MVTCWYVQWVSWLVTKAVQVHVVLAGYHLAPAGECTVSKSAGSAGSTPSGRPRKVSFVTALCGNLPCWVNGAETDHGVV